MRKIRTTHEAIKLKNLISGRLFQELFCTLVEFIQIHFVLSTTEFKQSVFIAFIKIDGTQFCMYDNLASLHFTL